MWTRHVHKMSGPLIYFSFCIFLIIKGRMGNLLYDITAFISLREWLFPPLLLHLSCVCVCVCLLMCAVTLPGADTRMIHRRPTRKSWIFFFSVFITQSPAWKDKYLPPFSYFNFFPCVIIFYFKLPRYHYGDGSLLHSAQNISWEIIKFCFFFSFFKNGAGGRK